jgi:glutamyl-tRNA reductase
MLFIDIAVPRNVDPSVLGVKNAFLCDVDGLQNILASRRKEIADTVRVAEQMVESEVDALSNCCEHREIGPVIATLKNRIELIGCTELERHIRKLATASPEDRQRLEEMVKRIANKILHPLIVQLKRQAHSSLPGLDFVETLTLAFGPDHGGMLDHENHSRPFCPEATAETFGTGDTTAAT